MEIEVGSADEYSVRALAGGIEELFWRLPVALYRSAPDGTLLAANPALADLLGFPSVESLMTATKSVVDYYVQPPQRELWLERISETGQVLDYDIELKRPDGSTVWVQDAARAVFDDEGSIRFCEGALIDMTEKVQARKARDEFVATVSHELRNPMSVLLGLAHEMAENYGAFSEDERREMSDVMARQADDASGIIEDLLVAYREDLSRVRVDTAQFDVHEEIERVLEGVEEPVIFEPEVDAAWILADPRRTRQILRNLVSNAVRYGGDEVKVVTRRADDQSIAIMVCDSGAALDPEEAQRIFQAYERGSGLLDARSVGLGLSVARKLAELMNGSLVYEHDGTYSSFVVTLPGAS